MKTILSSRFWAALCALATLLTAAAANAQVSEAAIKAEQNKWFALAAALGIGIAAFGGALGQGKAAAAALDGIARNPGASDKLFTPMILGLALIESLVIYALLISFLLYGKI
jgi:F-type H+-transporting ATPase subunit c